jgi:16S rRNA (guanine966-N2)-methyltransferase
MAGNSVRIIGGKWRGRKLLFPDQADLRPTLGRVRETVFNWLRDDVADSRCLDLFAGSGALGFEAASRGAARVVMVENHREALAALRANREALGAGAVEIVAEDAFGYLARAAECFDVVFLDPPFRQNALAAALERLPPRLAHGARVYVEAPRPQEVRAPWRELKRSRAGQVSFQLLIWEPA